MKIPEGHFVPRDMGWNRWIQMNVSTVEDVCGITIHQITQLKEKRAEGQGII